MRQAKSQRGYNLVEIGIVLVAAMMMGSWIGINYFQAAKDALNTQAEKEMLRIQEAIIGYAADHSNKTYAINNTDSTSPLQWRIPGGRPYLPCPDITGDGLEDRRPYLPGDTLTLSAAASQLEDGGDCYRYKGLVPWETLGVPPRDPWGHFYVYRVDRNFSNAAVGFDQQTRADQGVYTRLLSVVDFGGGITGAARPSMGGVIRKNRPATGGVRDMWSSDIRSENSPSIICEAGPCGAEANNATLIVGAVISPGTMVSGAVTMTGTVLLRTGGYELPSGAYGAFGEDDIVYGVPVVVMSHGENGHGAMYLDRDGDFACRNLSGDRAALDEAQNAFWISGGHPAGCNNVVTAPAMAAVRSGDGTQNGFVSRPRTNVGSPRNQQPFDDLVVWLSADDLADELQRRGVLPVELLPPLGLEDY